MLQFGSWPYATLRSHENSRLNKADTDSAPRWRSCKPDSIAWVGWGSDYVAYHRPSGGTHYLNPASRVLLDDILKEPKTEVAIEDSLRALGLEDESLEPGAVRSLLDRFEELGLIERA